MNDAIDPLLQTSSRSVDRRQMLQDLKARNTMNASTTEQPVSQSASASSRTKKKVARPARAAKIFVFGLSTTAMFGAVSGYALADLQQKQQTIPQAPVVPVAVPSQDTVASTTPSTNGDVTPQTSNATNQLQTKLRSKKDVAANPAVDTTPAAQTPAVAAPAQAEVVIDVPVPQSAQPGQGRASGGNQQSSGSY